jgi:hypothetical protein
MLADLIIFGAVFVLMNTVVGCLVSLGIFKLFTNTKFIKWYFTKVSEIMLMIEYGDKDCSND